MKITPPVPPFLIDCDDVAVPVRAGKHKAKSVHFELANNQVILNHAICSDDEDFWRQWYTDEDYDQFERHYNRTSTAREPRTLAVRFDMTSTQVHVIDSYSPETIRQRWYTECDFEQFKLCIRRDAHSVYKDESYRSYRVALSHMFAACCNDRGGSGNTEPVLCSTSQMLQYVFNRQIHGQSEVLGLDKYCIKSMVFDKLVRRRELYVFVQRQHAEICLGRGSCDDSMLRQGSEEISEPHCLYAQLMAQAIAYSVLKH